MSRTFTVDFGHVNYASTAASGRFELPALSSQFNRFETISRIDDDADGLDVLRIRMIDMLFLAEAAKERAIVCGDAMSDFLRRGKTWNDITKEYEYVLPGVLELKGTNGNPVAILSGIARMENVTWKGSGESDPDWGLYWSSSVTGWRDLRKAPSRTRALLARPISGGFGSKIMDGPFMLDSSDSDSDFDFNSSYDSLDAYWTLKNPNLQGDQGIFAPYARFTPLSQDNFSGFGLNTHVPLRAFVSKMYQQLCTYDSTDRYVWLLNAGQARRLRVYPSPTNAGSTTTETRSGGPSWSGEHITEFSPGAGSAVYPGFLNESNVRQNERFEQKYAAIEIHGVLEPDEGIHAYRFVEKRRENPKATYKTETNTVMHGSFSSTVTFREEDQSDCDEQWVTTGAQNMPDAQFMARRLAGCTAYLMIGAGISINDYTEYSDADGDDASERPERTRYWDFVYYLGAFTGTVAWMPKGTGPDPVPDSDGVGVTFTVDSELLNQRLNAAYDDALNRAGLPPPDAKDPELSDPEVPSRVYLSDTEEEDRQWRAEVMGESDAWDYGFSVSQFGPITDYTYHARLITLGIVVDGLKLNARATVVERPA